ncbi:two-component system sensor histidine kinase NtrB [Alicyclobacillus fastidiosus]|uniref:histidine kinase n=1 Tax=Alicyclobacillus fastidiosus TaxID=392011 RepID=A0ABV5AE39_9BACL|nr:ATP-binding protein [Alicyclobacillus fastidiosus]WEH09899.1 ATP-binding protein [Alicyclobacillus fastidiosus]
MSMKQQHPIFSVEPDLLPDTQLLNAGILYLAKDGSMAVLNDISAELIGMPQATGSIVPIDMALSEDSDEYQVLQHILQTECEYRDAVVRWEVGNDVRHVLMDTFVHQSQDGQVYGMYIVMKDMGNFAALDQQTQRVEKVATVGKVAAGIAHEIRNPLTTVKGFLQVLEGRLHNGLMDEEIQYVEVMMSEIERVNALVAELLLLSKPTKLDKRTFPLAELLQEIQPWMQAVARDHGVKFVYDVPADFALFGDRDMLRQLLLHLIKNAIEAMDVDGSLSIGARMVSGRTEIYISDTGPGIPYYLVDKIFDAFYTTKDKGTGLGLAICERIVADHGGKILVSSKGFGTTFTISLPGPSQHSANLFLPNQAHSLLS